MTGDAVGQAIGTCDVQENVAVVTETFSSFEVGCVATLVEGEASSGVGTAYEEEGALWESAQL